MYFDTVKVTGKEKADPGPIINKGKETHNISNVFALFEKKAGCRLWLPCLTAKLILLTRELRTGVQARACHDTVRLGGLDPVIPCPKLLPQSMSKSLAATVLLGWQKVVASFGNGTAGVVMVS